MRIISINANGLLNTEKRRAIFNKYRPICDIICIQETHCSKELEELWSNEWGGCAFYSHGTNFSRGVCTLINRNFHCNVLNTYAEKDGRILILEVEKEEKKYTIANIYAPNKDSPGFFASLIEHMEKLSPFKVIVGDFNLVLDVNLDRKNSYYNNMQAMYSLRAIMEDYQLTDIWRDRNPEIKRYS